MYFNTYEITFKRSSEDWVVVAGEIKNESKRNYSCAIFRIVLFDRKRSIGIGIVKINNFRGRTSKHFEVLIFGLHYRFIPKISRCEIMLESGY